MSLLDLHLHDKSFPGPLGFAAFAGIKFGGYMVAGLVLRKVYPLVVASPAKIAAVRTGLGVVLGPVFVIGLAALAAETGWSPDSYSLPYIMLVCIRVLIWAFVIWIFLRRTAESRRYLWINAAAGAAWSCLLDLPAFFLLAIAPGRIPIC
jgi:hypothetical protein